MYTYLLLLIVIVYLVFTLFYTNGDVSFPGSLILFAYAISMFFLVSEIRLWDAYISSKTFGIFVCGLTSYLLSSLLSSKFLSRFSISYLKRVSDKNMNVSCISLPDVSEFLNYAVILFDIIILIRYYQEVRRSSLSIGSFDSLGEMIGNYHNAAVFGQLQVGVSRLSTYGFELMGAFAYCYIYILNIHMIAKKETKLSWKILRLIPIILYILCSVLTGGRNITLQLICAAIIMNFIMKRIYDPVSRPLNLKKIIRLALILVIVLILFSQVRGLFGRTNQLDTFDYLAMYMGAPIKLFDMFVETPGLPNRFWGEETFINVYAYLGSILNDSSMSSLLMNKEFRIYKSYELGNVYTAFREYYNDFGLMGVIILSSIHSIFFTTWYCKLIRNHKKSRLLTNKIDLSVVIYSYLSVALIYFSIDDRLFQKFLSLGTFREIIFIILVIKLLPRLKLKIVNNQK